MTLTQKTDLSLLILRVWLGLNMAFSHGLGKMEHASDFLSAGSLEKFGAPVFFGIMAILAEFLGGILIALGLFTRTSAFFMVSVLAVPSPPPSLQLLRLKHSGCDRLSRRMIID